MTSLILELDWHKYFILTNQWIFLQGWPVYATSNQLKPEKRLNLSTLKSVSFWMLGKWKEKLIF